SGLGTSFTNFSTIDVDAGARWTLTGSNTLGAGTTLSDAGTLVYTGTLVNAGTISVTGSGVLEDPGGTLINSGSISGPVTLTGGDYLDNQATGIITSTGDAVVGTTSPNTVVNAGTIESSGTTGSGVRLAAGGSGTNGPRGGPPAVV